MKIVKLQPRRSTKKSAPTLKTAYDVVVDAKKRISLRGAKAKYYHVRMLSDGSYLLEPRVLVPPAAVSVRTLKMLAKSSANLKKGRASAPIDLSALADN